MEAPGFWDNAEQSQMKMKELKGLKDDALITHERFEELQKRFN